MLPLFWNLDVLDFCCAVNQHSETNLIFSKFHKIARVLSVVETKITTENASSRDWFVFGGNYKSEDWLLQNISALHLKIEPSLFFCK